MKTFLGAFVFKGGWTLHAHIHMRLNFGAGQREAIAGISDMTYRSSSLTDLQAELNRTGDLVCLIGSGM